MVKRTIIIGDIHGLKNELLELLNTVSYDKKFDRLIFAGDLVDRGPDSAGVIQFAIENDVEVTIGNHDDKYIRYRRHERSGRKNPIELRSEKANVWRTLTDEHLSFLESQPCYIHIPEYNCMVVHAGVLPGKPIDKQERETYLFVRYVNRETHKKIHMGPNFSAPENGIHWTELYDGTVDIIYGHDVQSIANPVVRCNSKGARTIGIDTGACFGGRLSAIVFSEKNPRGEFVQVESKFIYKKFKIVQR